MPDVDPSFARIRIIFEDHSLLSFVVLISKILVHLPSPISSVSSMLPVNTKGWYSFSFFLDFLLGFVLFFSLGQFFLVFAALGFILAALWLHLAFGVWPRLLALASLGPWLFVFWLLALASLGFLAFWLHLAFWLFGFTWLFGFLASPGFWLWHHLAFGFWRWLHLAFWLFGFTWLYGFLASLGFTWLHLALWLFGFTWLHLASLGFWLWLHLAFGFWLWLHLALGFWPVWLFGFLASLGFWLWLHLAFGFWLWLHLAFGLFGFLACWLLASPGFTNP